MRFEFTVQVGCDEHDLLVCTPRPLRLGEIWARLPAVLGTPVAPQPDLDPGVLLGSRRLATGSVVRADRGRRSAATQPPGGTGLELHVIGGRDAGRTVPLPPGAIHIGRDPHSGIVLRDERVSRRHATVRADAGGAVLEDDASTNGTTLESKPVARGGSRFAPGAVARVGDTLFTVRDRDEPSLPVVASGDRRQVTRVRRDPDQSPAVVEVAGPVPRAGARPTQWLAALIPAVAGGGLAWLTRSPTFLLFALLSPVMLLGTAFGDRLHLRRSRRATDAARVARDASDEQAVARALRAETQARRSRHPDPVLVARAATVPTIRLWQRGRGDEDVLTLRIGSASSVSGTRLRRDSTTEPAGLLSAAPVVVDLRDGPVGFAGPPEAVDGLARCLVSQLAVLHPPGVVGLALFLRDAAGEARWQWARWLPHLGDHVARSAGEWRASAERVAAAAQDGRWVVAVIDRAAGPPSPGGVDELLGAGRCNGVTALVFGTELAQLPPWCTRTVDLWARPSAGAASAGPADLVLDQVAPAWAEQVARALAPLSDATGGTAVTPDRCHLLDVLDLDLPALDGPAVAEVLERWSASDGRPDTAVGLTATGRLELDLERDGPHALVAGTTGSGKSELLRSLVLGLALQHPPDELTFVLVDYKGGAAFAECSALPHAVGSVTDLDPHLTRRALHSLEAELRRRERLFAGVGASDLAGYRRSDGPPLPRLVIVVDEFAALADVLPDFLHGLISVARRGRSLGVHLVLATQRPGTAVTPEIRANTSCRIALRVIEPAESSDVIGVPDAAGLPRRLPGRALLGGDGPPVEFQAAAVEGAARDRPDEVTVERLGPWRDRPAPSARDGAGSCARIVEIVRLAAVERGAAPPAGPWLAPLPEQLASGSLPAPGADRVPLGLVDLPGEQRQDTLGLDLSQPSSWLVVGGPRSGRTTTLLGVALAAARAQSPSELEIYVLDGAGPLAAALHGLPQMATCLGPGELAAAGQLLRRLAGRGPGPVRTLLLIDHAERVLVDDDAGVAPCTHELGKVLAKRRATVLGAGSRALLAARVSSGFEHRLLLRLPDRADYALAGVAARDIPTTLPPGRAVRVHDGAEVQLAFGGGSPGVGSAAPAVRAVAARWRDERAGAGAVRVRPLPRTLDLRSLPVPVPAGRMRLGVGGESAGPVHLDPSAGPQLGVVAGPARSGRTTTLLTLMSEAHRIGIPLLVAAPQRSALLGRALELGLPTLLPSSTPGERPQVPTLVLVDDCESFGGTVVDDVLGRWIRDGDGLSVVISGRSDELASAYRGLAAEVRRARCGLLLQPGPLDGELLDVRLPRRVDAPPGRGVLVGWPGATAEDGAPLDVQVARP